MRLDNNNEVLSWHAIATLALFILWSVVAALAWDMRSDVKAIQVEIARQTGVDAAQRQQIDLNTAHLQRIDQQLLEHVQSINRLEVIMGYWKDRYNWKEPPRMNK